MSSGSIDNNLITQFSDMLHIKAQQNPSRLRPHVIVKQMTGDLYAYDGLGQVEAREVNGRVTPTVFDEISHNRRKISRRRFVVTLPIDASDTRGVLLNPEGEYAGACMKAMNRQWDRVGVEASFANVSTGRDFGTSVTFTGDGGIQVDATAGVTYEKLLELRKSWTNNEVGNDSEEKFMLLITGTEEEALLKELELTSGDFTRQSVVDKGRIAMAAGIDLLVYGADVTNPIINVNGSSQRECVGLTGRALCYGLSKDMSINIKDRPDFVETKQVQIVGQWGAVRTEGVLMKRFLTTE